MALIGWIEEADVASYWEDADGFEIGEPLFVDLLTAAYVQCAAYAPVLAEADPVPANYRLAQVMQARALWQMQRTGTADSYGADGYAIVVYPLDARIKALLRPTRVFGGLL